MIDAKDIRKTIIDIAYQSGEGHIGSSYSIIEMLLSIHMNEQNFRGFDIKNLVLSKGHASYGYYAFLYHIGLMSPTELKSVGQTGSKFYGHLPFVAAQ